jgi:ATP-dependent helicase/nuclease subunit A
LADPEDDAVRILTIHAAKGLEFPVVVLAGLNTDLGRRAPGPQILWDEQNRPQVRISKLVGATSGYDRSAEHEKAMDEHEQLRLLYVGATRACERLLVSTHRLTRDRGSHAARLAGLVESLAGPELVTSCWPAEPVAPSAAIAAAATAPEPARVPLVQPAPEAGVGVGVGVAEDDPESARVRRAEWLARRTAVLVTADAPVRSATALGARLRVDPPADPAASTARSEATADPAAGAAGVGRPEVDLDGGAGTRWLRPAGEAATAFGRAVHGALQDVSLPAADDLDAVAARQARVEGVPERAADVARSVRAALAAPTVRQLTGGRFWREVYVGAPIGGTLVEGFVDLLGETSQGLVVVDYKTDAADPDVLLERYAGQLAAYAVAVGSAVGRPVARALLVCCGGPGDAVEREVADLAGAMAAVAAAAASEEPELHGHRHAEDDDEDAEDVGVEP